MAAAEYKRILRNAIDWWCPSSFSLVVSSTSRIVLGWLASMLLPLFRVARSIKVAVTSLGFGSGKPVYLGVPF